MIKLSEDEWRHAFPMWLRTGKLLSAQTGDAIECKFNPWHDPDNGRFTFAGAGNYHGVGESEPIPHARRRLSRDNPQKSRIATAPTSMMPRSVKPATFGERAKGRGATGKQPNPAAEFAGGLGEGLYGVAEGTISALHSVLTTNPATTIRNTGFEIASMIDKAIAAEDTPARIQVSRAADAVATASARDIGRVSGSVVGNVALVAVPGAALSKVSKLRRLRMAPPSPVYDPPQIGWVKENLGPDKAWRRYNDAATGARPGEAPTLMRTMPDGSKRPVKFDGIQGEYLIDRKWKVVTAPRARAQLLRQSQVLAQHGLIGTWEVPTVAQKARALKLLKEMKIANIKVRVVQP